MYFIVVSCVEVYNNVDEEQNVDDVPVSDIIIFSVKLSRESQIQGSLNASYEKYE